ncbi:MAG: NYN domain-containing protein [Candidatus Electrothrix sp. YB6]
MNTECNVAVYWDFENIHISLSSLKMGESWYKDNMYSKQPAFIDIRKIMDYISSIGEVNINKSYANWSFFHAYSFELQNYSIDLIQMYHCGKYGKNGSDIRIAIDILDDCIQQPHLDTIVLISGDSDYISIAQKVRQRGKRIIGIGVQETTNQFWIKACNKFKFYSALIKEDDISENGSQEDFDDAKNLLIKALKIIFSESGSSSAPRVSIKPVMLRLDPSFDENNYGCSNFTEFLNQCQESIVIKESDKDVTVSLRSSSKHVETPSVQVPHLYEIILKKQKIRLVRPEIMKQGIKDTFDIFHEEKIFSSYRDYRNNLLIRLKKTIPDIQDTDAAKIKDLIYKAFCFKVNSENKSVSLVDDVKTCSDLEERIYRMLVKRILDNVSDNEDIDTDYLSDLLFGDKARTDDTYELIIDYNRRIK